MVFLVVFYINSFFYSNHSNIITVRCLDNKGMKKTSNINKLIKSKYPNVYTREVYGKDGIKKDTKVYISINNSRRLLGLKSSGITELYAFNFRNDEVARMKLGEDPRLSNKKEVLLFSELAEDWMDKQQAEQLKEAKKNTQRYHMHIEAYFAKLPANDIKPQMILEYKKEKLNTLQPATVYYLCGIINSIFHNAIYRTGKMAAKTNPAYKIFTKKEFNNKRERWLTLEEIHLLLHTIQKSDSKVKLSGEFFVRISLSTGVRIGSALILQKKHFNLEKRTVELYDAKNRQFYSAYLNDKLLSTDYLHNMLDHLKNDDYVLRYKDKPLQRKTLHRFTYPIYKKLFNQGIDASDEKNKVCNHTLRHTFATHAVKHNDIFLVQKLMNHKDINQTLRYAKVDEDKKAEAVAKMF